MTMPDVLVLLGDTASVARGPAFTIEVVEDAATLAAYHRLRHYVFVEQQGLFSRHDLDERDADPRTVVLVARDADGTVLGGVRLGPVTDGVDLGWWQGGRLVVDPAHRSTRRVGLPRSARRFAGLNPASSLLRAETPGSFVAGASVLVSPDAGGPLSVGSALVDAACAHAENAGVLRFEATVQARNERFFVRLGWELVRPVTVAGTAHVLMRKPIRRIAALAAATKSALGPLLAGLTGVPGFVGDDGVPVPGSDLVAACDAILPSMVERDPEWAGWCSVLVNVNDLAAMGATPVGLLDALGARDASFASRVLTGLRKASEAYAVPVLGGHTQLGVPAALSVTALGRTQHPVPGGGGRPGHAVRLTADLGGRWRRGYTGRQWDSTTSRTPGELRAMLDSVGAGRPAAAKDVSMAGVAGTLGMLAEASGCGAVLDVAAVPRPAHATAGDWLTCFPGFAMLTTDTPGAPVPPAGPAVTAECGELVAGDGVRLRWPDGTLTEVVPAGVTGLGRA